MRVYLDYNATTPVDPAVLDAMLPFLADNLAMQDPFIRPGSAPAPLWTLRANPSPR